MMETPQVGNRAWVLLSFRAFRPCEFSQNIDPDVFLMTFPPPPLTRHPYLMETLKIGRWAWTLLSFRAFLLRMAARIAGRLYLGGAGLALKACKGGDGFVRPPWPPGAMPPVIFGPSP